MTPDEALVPRLKSIAAIVVLVVLVTVPLGICVPFVLAAPHTSSPDWQFVFHVADLDPAGTPAAVVFRGVQYDAWQRKQCAPRKLFVVRHSDDALTVLSAEHHERLRMPVEFDSDDGVFRSVCWEMTFDLFGRCREVGDRTCDMCSVESRVVAGQLFVRLD